MDVESCGKHVMKSMTGYGCGKASDQNSAVTVEISTVNHKGLDFRFNVPPELDVFQPLLKREIQASISRGTVHVTVNHELTADQKAASLTIDRNLVARLVQQLKALQQDFPELNGNVNVGKLLDVPGVISYNEMPLPRAQLEPLIEGAVRDAAANLDKARAEEGRALARDLACHCDRLSDLVDVMSGKQDEIVQSYRARLHERIRLLEVELTLDDERLAREVAFAAQKSDINEELVRLRSHLDRFRECLSRDGDEPPGREMFFLCQEMHREINTLGAKARDTTIANDAVEFKKEEDKLKEQVQNVE